jgi:polyhydroxyalkanoate synthase
MEQMAGTNKDLQSEYQLADPAEFTRNLTIALEKSAEIARFLADLPPRTAEQEMEAQITPIGQVTKTLGDVAQFWMTDPAKLADAQMRLLSGHAALWQNAWRRLMGEEVQPVIYPDRTDRRFKDQDWDKNQLFDFLKQSYLITTRWAGDMVREAEVDDHTRLKARFYVEQIANAFSPSNFMFTNPEVLRTTLASNGANLIEGLDHLKRDLEAGDGRLRIKQTDTEAFEVGVNLATTPGKVVFRNDVMELIQYAPQGKTAHEIPLVITPPWINKFYILDLNPKKSFIRWAVEQGYTVFVISWANADEKGAYKSFADYMKDGFIAAVDKAREICGTEKVNAIGYCIGGTLVSAALAYMQAKGEQKVNAVTFFTTQVDFEKAGDLLVYVDEEQVKWIEQRMAEKGYLPGKRMADAFNLLRSNDLIWSYVVNNYLLGRDPVPFDLLYWNSDGTRMPAGVHSFYLRECYLNNKLAKSEMVLDGTRIDLRTVDIPIYNLAAREDHIAPLASVFRLGQHFAGPTRMVASGSGHIAGVVNPPDANKYQFWTNENANSGTLEDWMKGATETPGSWWPDWNSWLAPKSGQQVPARKVTNGMEDAPGTYVRIKGVD